MILAVPNIRGCSGQGQGQLQSERQGGEEVSSQLREERARIKVRQVKGAGRSPLSVVLTGTDWELEVEMEAGRSGRGGALLAQQSDRHARTAVCDAPQRGVVNALSCSLFVSLAAPGRTLRPSCTPKRSMIRVARWVESLLAKWSGEFQAARSFRVGLEVGSVLLLLLLLLLLPQLLLLLLLLLLLQHPPTSFPPHFPPSHLTLRPRASSD
jgi:hypothetical protein